MISLSPMRLVCAAGIGLLAVGAAPGHAQSRVDAGAIERTIPAELLRSGPAQLISAPTVETVGAQAQTGRFTLGAVSVEGATAFSQEALSRYFEPHLATEVDETTLNRIAEQITKHYHRAGYLLSYAMVPAQDVQAGIVRIVVVEGRVEAVSVDGAGADVTAVRAAAAPVLRDAPLRASTLERTIGLIRDTPGYTVVDVGLGRSDEAAGLHALKLVVALDRVRAFAYVDNRTTAGNGRMRAYSSASHSSIAIEGDELRVDLFAMRGRRFSYLYGQLLAGVPLGSDGLRLTLSASRGDQRQRTALNKVDGDSANLSAQLSYPIIRARALTMTAKASISDVHSSGDLDQSRSQRDRLRVARIGIAFSNESSTRISGELSLSRGLGFGAMTKVGDARASRPDAGGRFTKAAFSLQVAAPITPGTTVRGVLAGQYSDRPLLSAEEFALGGSQVGRAFAFNSLTGERGLGAGLEVGQIVARSGDGSRHLELFGFVDGGAVSEAPSSATRRNGRTLASAGVGSRFTIAGLSVSLEAGLPIDSAGGKKSVQGFFSISRAF